MIITFCGHAQISHSQNLQDWLFTVTRRLIESGAKTFYLGGYGVMHDWGGAAAMLR